MNIFRDQQQYQLFLSLVLSSLFGLSMIIYRSYAATGHFDLASIFVQKGNSTFLFLIWNLFLAWIPYGIALLLHCIRIRPSTSWITGACLLAWLLFFPNAPYLLTDLLHLRARPPIPIWYDTLLFITFVWTGLMLGLASLYEVQLFFRQHFSNTLSWMVVGFSIPLCGLGIYIGRFLRWNSWDILIQPSELCKDILHIFLYPTNFRGLPSVFLISIFLLIVYLFFLNLADGQRKSIKL